VKSRCRSGFHPNGTFFILARTGSASTDWRHCRIFTGLHVSSADPPADYSEGGIILFTEHQPQAALALGNPTILSRAQSIVAFWRISF
jgi:hypothetical protein